MESRSDVLTGGACRAYQPVPVTVAVAMNLAGGVVLGADTLITVTMGAANKTYPGGTKLFGLGGRGVGVAAYGVAVIGGRTIESFIAEFIATHPGASDPAMSVGAVAEALRTFVEPRYVTAYPDPSNRPPLGLILGGFSPGRYEPEIWEVAFPAQIGAAAHNTQKAGAAGAIWRGIIDPIERYYNGVDPGVFDNVLAFVEAAKGPLAETERDGLRAALRSRAASVPMNVLPMPDAIDFVRFLVRLVIDHHRFDVTANGVGGNAMVGVVTAHDQPFRIVE